MASPQASASTPAWLGANWGSAFARAVGAVLIGIGIQYVLGLLLALGVLATNQATGFGSVDWGNLLTVPFFVWMGMQGAVEGNPVWLTAIVWTVVAVHLTRRYSIGVVTTAGQGSVLESAIQSAKVALVYAAAVIVLLIVFDPVSVSYGTIIGPGSAIAWEPAAAFFTSFFVVFLASWGLDVYSARSRVTYSGWMRVVAAGVSGTRSILLIGVLGLLAFAVVGVLLELIGSDLGVFGWISSLLVSLVVAVVLWAGVDVGMALFASGMQLFRDDAFTTADRLLGDPAWLMVGSAIVVVAFGVGGFRAARATGSDQLNRHLQAAGVAGLGVAVAFVVASFVVGSRIDEIRSGVGLSLLWTLVSLGGGLWFAQTVGALEGVVSTPGASAVVGEASKHCVTCGAALPADAAFCSSCGSASPV